MLCMRLDLASDSAACCTVGRGRAGRLGPTVSIAPPPPEWKLLLPTLPILSPHHTTTTAPAPACSLPCTTTTRPGSGGWRWWVCSGVGRGRLSCAAGAARLAVPSPATPARRHTPQHGRLLQQVRHLPARGQVQHSRGPGGRQGRQQ